MSRFAVYIPVLVDDETTVKELTRIFGAAGYMVRADDQGRWCADPVPGFLRKEAAPKAANPDDHKHDGKLEPVAQVGAPIEDPATNVRRLRGRVRVAR
jgi:hypothetical protein